MKPEIIRRIVVLPQPEGPRKLKNSPALDGQDDVADSGECAEAHGDVVEFDVLAHETSWKGRHPLRGIPSRGMAPALYAARKRS